MVLYIERNNHIDALDPCHTSGFQILCNSFYGKKPEIISFTDFLRWNYTTEYGHFIRRKYNKQQLPLPWDVNHKTGIYNVLISEGFYDRVDEDTFSMYVICEVTFQNGVIQRYCVSGYHSLVMPSNYLVDVGLYHGEYLRLHHRLNKYLIPHLNRNQYDTEAYQILKKYQPKALKIAAVVNGVSLAETMGYHVIYRCLSRNGSVKGKIIFLRKDMTFYDKNGKPYQETVANKTIIVAESFEYESQKADAIVHECIHAYEHKLFFALQAFYRTALGKEAPGFDEYFFSAKQEEIVKWMENQAEHITYHVRMPEEITYDTVADYLDRLTHIPTYDDYRLLINHIAWRFKVSRGAAKKRIVDLGWHEVRGIYVWLLTGYVEDYDIDENFPRNCTYTLPLHHISDICSVSPEFAALVKSGRYLYVDGHMIRNLPQFVHHYGKGIYALTDEAKCHMRDCCIAFKHIYEDPVYAYTFGELNKEDLSAIVKEQFDEEQNRQIMSAFHEAETDYNALQGEKSNDALAAAVKYHMKRCHVTAEQLADRTWLSESTITNLRTGNGSFKLETILAFCVGLELEETFRKDLLLKAHVDFDTRKKSHRMYMSILELVPEANVFQINKILIDNNFTAWTRQKKRQSVSA